MKIGVLAIQGDFREHRLTLEKLGVEVVEVRLPKDLEGVSGLIIPGGESTTIGKLLRWYKLDEAIISRVKSGMSVFGTCAGAIILSKKIVGNEQFSLGLLDISISRNAYGRQIDSFETSLDIEGVGKVKTCFIRAPIISEVGGNVEVLASHDDKPVLVQEGNVLAATFHSELNDEKKVHEYFISMIKE